MMKNEENTEVWQRNFSRNLKTIKRERGVSLSEFANELSVPKSTLQNVLRDGNTTLHTAVRIAKALGRPLDELLEAKPPIAYDLAAALEKLFTVYGNLDEEKKQMFKYHLDELLKLAIS